MPAHEIITARVDPATFQSQVAAVIDRPIAEGTATATAEAGNVRRLTHQLRGRRGRPRQQERWICLVYLSQTAGGAPAAVTATSLVSGRIIQTITADAEWLIETDADATIAFDVTLSGADTRYLNVAALGRVDRSAAFTWA